VLVVEGLLGDSDGGHRFGPARVEREVDDRFLELGLGEAVLLRDAEVGSQLLSIAAGDQRGDGDQAAVPRRELGAFSDITEENVVGERERRW